MTYTALLVRTASTISDTRQVLESKGIEVIPAPVMKIDGIHPEPGVLRNLIADNDVLCCLSKNAVQQLRYYQGQLPYSPRVWAVGAGTRKAMQGLFDNVCSPTQETSEGLFQEMAWELKPGTRVCLLKGVGGRKFLTRTLFRTGAIITQINLYRRVVDEKALQTVSDILAFKRPSVIMVGSGELLQVINKIIPENTRQIPVVVPGIRVAELAKSLGFANVIKADGASADAFYSALTQLRQQSMSKHWITPDKRQTALKFRSIKDER